MPVTIRETRPSGFENLANYYFEFYDELKENPRLGLTLFDKKPSMLDEMGWFLGFERACQKGAVGLVAVENEEIVGFCEVDRRKPTSAVSHRGGLGITVRKGYRGKGIGTILLKRMIEKCKKRERFRSPRARGTRPEQAGEAPLRNGRLQEIRATIPSCQTKREIHR